MRTSWISELFMVFMLNFNETMCYLYHFNKRYRHKWNNFGFERQEKEILNYLNLISVPDEYDDRYYDKYDKYDNYDDNYDDNYCDICYDNYDDNYCDICYDNNIDN